METSSATPTSPETRSIPMTAVLFPGQGSQEPGMGRDVAEAHPEAMELWKTAERAAGVRLREIYWDGDEAAQTDTRYVQPALTVVNLTLWQRLAARVTPACVAGHSLGEFSALAAAGVLDPARVLELVSLRGRLMAEADPAGKGRMAAVVKLNLASVEEIVAEVVRATGEMLLVANHNSPAQYVLSGTAAAVAAVEPLVKERKGRAIGLAVSGAFHSPMMAEAAKELEGAMKRLDWRRPRCPVFLNVTGEAATDAEAIHAAMARQMISSVRWVQTVAGQWDMGVRRWLEVGPKTVLTKLLKANLEGRDGVWEGLGVGGLAQVEALAAG